MSLPPKIKLVENKVLDYSRIARPYSLLIFIIFVGAIYGFVLLRVHNLTSLQPSESQVTSQVKATQVPRIDPKIVLQLQSLQDNSVSVKALFDQARSNPFNQ